MADPDAIVRAVLVRMPVGLALGLSLYFAGTFLYGGARTLIWLYRGATDAATATIAEFCWRVLGLPAAELALVAAALGAFQLALGGFFALAVIERAPVLWRGTPKAAYESLELAVICAAALTLVFAGSAWSSGDVAGLRMQAAHVMLLIVAAGCDAYARTATAPSLAHELAAAAPRWHRPAE
jgi:hypothetical protein